MKDLTIALFAEDLSTADLDSIYNLNQANVPEVGSVSYTHLTLPTKA